MHVHVERGVPLFGRTLFDVAPGRPARGMDKDVEAPERGDRPVDQLRGCNGLADVGGQDLALAPGCRHGTFDVGRVLGDHAAVDRHVAAQVGQIDRHRRADAASAAGN